MFMVKFISKTSVTMELLENIFCGISIVFSPSCSLQMSSPLPSYSSQLLYTESSHCMFCTNFNLVKRGHKSDDVMHWSSISIHVPCGRTGKHCLKSPPKTTTLP